MTIQAVILAALLAIQYRHVINGLQYQWRTNGDWSHGFLIPFFSLYYLYTQRHRIPLSLPDRSWIARLTGAGIILLSFALLVAAILYKTEYPKRVALVLSILGVVLMTCGYPLARWSWFAVAFLVFALPLPERLYVQLTMPLRFIAAQISAPLLGVVFGSGMTAEANGATVDWMMQLPDGGMKAGTLDIEQACSGIRLMMTMMALGVAMAFMSERSMWQRLVMVLACVPIAIFCNIIRVTTTGVFYVTGHEDLARGFWHTMLGLGMLMIAFSLYGAISFVLRQGIPYVMNHLFVEGEPQEQA